MLHKTGGRGEISSKAHFLRCMPPPWPVCIRRAPCSTSSYICTAAATPLVLRRHDASLPHVETLLKSGLPLCRSSYGVNSRSASLWRQ